jgi:hypothetical protein
VSDMLVDWEMRFKSAAAITRLTAERDAARAECRAWRQFDRAMLRDPQVAGECLREARVRGEANPMPEAP